VGWKWNVLTDYSFDAEWLLVAIDFQDDGWCPVNKEFEGVMEELIRDGIIEKRRISDPNWPGCNYMCRLTEEGRNYIEREDAIRVLAK
jgi:hypothetical protein